LLADKLVFDEMEPNLHIVHPSATPVAVRKSLGSVDAGRRVYSSAGCATCHGGEGQGSRQAPVLRVAGRILNSVVLAAKLTRSENRMCQRARSLKIAPPALKEDEIADLVSFLNGLE
jgi:cytochrome c553